MAFWNSILSIFRGKRVKRGSFGTYKFADIEKKYGIHLDDDNQAGCSPPSPNRESGVFEDFTMENSVLSDTRIHPTKTYFQNRYLKNTYGSDSALSVAISDDDLLSSANELFSSAECPRCRSCVLDSRFDIFGATRLLNETTDSSDCGYDSMDNSNTSIASLVRVTSIQDKSLKLMRKRHQKVAAKRKHARTRPDESNRCFDELGGSIKDFKIPSIKEERQVHFDKSDDDEGAKEKSVTTTKKKILNKNQNGSLKITRNSSIQMKSWQIRRQRKDLCDKRKKEANRLSLSSLRYASRESLNIE